MKERFKTIFVRAHMFVYAIFNKNYNSKSTIGCTKVFVNSANSEGSPNTEIKFDFSGLVVKPQIV
jgi:hypothetical protein